MSDADNSNLADQATLQLLIEIENTSSVSQRELSARIGLALGFTNALVKRAILKGLLKVHEAPAKRYAYYLTPKGFAEKSRLVGEYLTSSLDFFRMARDESSKIHQSIINNNHKRIVLYGVSELAEITIMASHIENCDVDCIIDPLYTRTDFSGLEVLNDFTSMSIDNNDAVIITNSEKPQAAYDYVRKFVFDKQIYATPFLHLRRNPDKPWGEP